MTTLHVVTDATFERHVLQAAGLVLVDDRAHGCAPCRPMVPSLEAVAQQFAGDLTTYKLNVDENPETRRVTACGACRR